MSLLSYLIPRTLLHTSSRYNQDIRVMEEWGVRRLLVNGSRQSGPTIQELWEKAIDAFGLPQFPDQPSILVLGVGGGTVMRILSERTVKPYITAVDIDATIISIAKKYFGFDSFPFIQFIVDDAKKYISAPPAHSYDLIVIDLFIGRIIPEFVTLPSFYQSLKRCLKPQGVVIVNYLRELDYLKKSNTLNITLKTIFHDVRDFSISNNRFFFAALDK
ncbi:MAG: fused MFS/spermidine synthase [Candidatus Gottesmanbacteria bacterium]|nr:fused MFS/spermidine synthase [Candidatus Gottesmanbacteria bacterium]